MHNITVLNLMIYHNVSRTSNLLSSSRELMIERNKLLYENEDFDPRTAVSVCCMGELATGKISLEQLIT